MGGVSDADAVLTVSELNRRVGRLLEGQFPRVWVKGEISNFTRAASGHWYFTVKDERAAVRAVMFRGRASSVGFVPKAGERFEFRGVVTLYEPRGDYQLQVDMLRRAGLGDLHEAFLLLKNKLEAEGLFDTQRKRPIPVMPATIGVVTSLAAAALRDVLSVLARRAPHVPVIIYPAPVQGADAPARLVQALDAAVRRSEVDVLLLVRGGGSLEDLWSFNDEALARALAACPIPVISGVGHETDFTIADFVADLRAPTPTAAAELSCQSREASLALVRDAFDALTRHQRRRLETAALRLDRATAGLVSPSQRVARQREALDAVAARLDRAMALLVERSRARLDYARARSARAVPDTRLARRDLERNLDRLATAGGGLVRRRRDSLSASLQTLQALDPRRVLGRGYALVRNRGGHLVKNALDLNIDERLDIEFGQGRAEVAVVSALGPSAGRD
jgi:exodeoxyribonuclease VII large subunit